MVTKKTDRKKMKVIIAKMRKPMPGAKKCPRCKTMKPLASFGLRKTKHVRDGKTVVVSRPQSYCQPCRGKHKAKNPRKPKVVAKKANGTTRIVKVVTKNEKTARKIVQMKAKAKPAAKPAPKKNHAPKPSLKELVSGKSEAVQAAVQQHAAEKKADADF